MVITVPAKKKELLRSHKLVTLDEFPEGFTPARMADITCCIQRTGHEMYTMLDIIGMTSKIANIKDSLKV